MKFKSLSSLLFLFVAMGLQAEDKKEKTEWKSLFDGKTLAGWKSSDFFKPGEVRVKDGLLIIEKGSRMTGVTYDKKDFPKMNYEVTLEGKRIDGNDFFCTTTFPIGDSHCSFVVGGWGGSTIGISSINGVDASENITNQSKEFEKDKWYRLRIRVSEKKLEVWIDDEKMVNLETKNLKFSTRIDIDPAKPFGIATYKTTSAIRDIKVRDLTAADKAESEKKD